MGCLSSTYNWSPFITLSFISYLNRRTHVRACSDEDLGRSCVVQAGRHMQRCPPNFPDVSESKLLRTLREININDDVKRGALDLVRTLSCFQFTASLLNFSADDSSTASSARTAKMPDILLDCFELRVLFSWKHLKISFATFTEVSALFCGINLAS